MSTDPDKDTACPKADKVVPGTGLDEGDTCLEVSEKKRKKPSRSVRFPDEDQLVTQYFEPANPWQDVPNTTRAQLAADYLEGCRRHNTTPIDSVLQQIRELPENSIGGGNRAGRLTLSECSLAGAAPVDALEALLRKVQFRRLEIQYCEVDDEGAEAMFDMIEYYESATVVSITGPRQFGIRGWQAACRMIKKSAELSELSLCESALCASHAPVLVRALRPHTCRLRALCLQRAELRGEPLLCLVIALKSNTSIRELRLPDNQLSVSDAQQLASLLKLNLHIQLLDLSNNDIQDAGTGHIADALVEQAAQTPPSAATSPLSPLHCPPGGRETRLGLAFLVLWNNQLTRNCAPHLTKALRSSQSLCVLNIGRNALGADTVRALQCGSSLVSLGLQCARLGPAAARPLADLLRADTKLQRLDLRDNRLGVTGLQAILNAMQENTTLTQIDLDDPVESSTLSAEDGEAATVARLTRDIAALCRRNEPPATEPERRVHRKISLTCHTAFAVKAVGRGPERARTARLRSPAPSPAPSPAGSPVPHAPHNSRFNVTRVTPDRESSTESTSPVPSRTPYCLTPSRFKVVQVAEPPQIQIHPAGPQKRQSSRFSVTRNYDAMYNPSPPSVSPTPSVESPRVSPSPSVSPVPNSPTPVGGSPTVMTGSPTVTGASTVMTATTTVMTKAMSGLPTVMTASPTVITGSALVMSGSPTVMTATPTMMKSSPTVMSGVPTLMTATPAVISGSPTVMTATPALMTGSPTVMSGSPAVLNGTPTVMTGSSAVMSGSSTVMTGPPTVMTATPTMMSFSPTVMTATPTVMTGSPTVMSGSPTVITATPAVMTGSPTVMSGTPTVMTGSSAVMSGSPTVMTGSSTVMTATTTMMTGSPMVITATPTVMTGSPTVMSGSPTVTTATPAMMTGSPTMISAEPIVMTGSPTVMSGSPTVMTGSLTVMSGSPTVMTGSPTVMTPTSTIMAGSPTVTTSSPKVMTGSLIGTGSSTVMSGSSTATGSTTAVTGSLIVTGSSKVMTGSPIVAGSSTVMTGLTTMMTSSPKVASGPTTTELSTALSSVLPINTCSLATNDSPKVVNESPSLTIIKGSKTVGVLTTASVTEILANDTPTMTTPISSAATGPNLATRSPILTSLPTTISISIEKSITASSVVTSVVKTSMSSLLTAVPIAPHKSHLQNVGSITDKTVKTVTVQEQVRVEQEVHASKISDSHNIIIGSIKKDVYKNEIPVFKTGSIAEDFCMNSARPSNVISTFVSGASIDTLTGTIVSGTSLDTLRGTISGSLIGEAYKDVETIESLTKVTDFEPTWSNIDPILSSRNTDTSRLEPMSGPSAIPKNVLEPDNCGFSHEHCDTFKEISKPIVIGSHSNITATENKVPVNIEADILTMLAEITEKVEPKVVEPKALPDSIDLNKQNIEDIPILDTITSGNKAVSQVNTPITVFTEVSGNTDLKVEKSIDLDKPTEISQQITPKQNILKPIDISEQFPAENKGSYIDLRSLATKESKIAAPFEESIQNKELDKVDLKSILIDKVRNTDTNAELPKAKEAVDNVAEFDYSSKLEDVTPHINISDSDKVSNTKSSENVRNKTYSDAVKTDPKYLDKSEQLTHREEISDSVVKTETKLVKNSVEVCESDKLDVQIEVTIKKESVHDAKVHSDQNKDFVKVDDIIIKKEPRTMKQIEALTEDLGNLIQEMKDMSSKSRKVKSDCTVDIGSIETNTVPGNFNRDVVLKKNKSESSLDSPDLEVSRLMNKKLVGSPFCDSSSSLEVSGSSMESLNATEHQHATCHVIPKQVVIQESVESDTELDRRKDVALSMGSSIESASDVAPVNSGNYLNMSVSSNESVSPIIFGKKKRIHDSLSSLEASMSSLDSGRQEKVMVTSADSGIEYSLQQPFENKEDNSSNEGTLTHNSSLRETVKKTEQETLTPSPKRTSSLLDVPALKTKGLDRMRKISWVAPSSSFHIPKVETEKLEKPSHLEKLLSLFQHPTSLFSRSQSDEEKKSASNTPPRKDSSLTSSFWSWGSTIEKDDKEDSSEATDSTLSERVQVSFVDESFSKKLDSKTPSTDTDNTLSEFQSFPIQTNAEKVTDTTDEDLVQKCLGLSLTDKAGSNGNSQRASDTTDLNKPNDLNRNYDVSNINEEKSENKVVIDKDDKDIAKIEAIRPRSFAAVLKSSGSENSLDKQPSPESGQPVDKLPSKVIRGIKENISPENTLTSSMTNTKTLALELTERQVKNQPIVNTVWEVPILDKSELRIDEVRTHGDLAPIATIDETCDEAADNTVNVKLEFIDDVKTENTDLIDIDSLKRKEVILGRNTERRSDLRKEEVIFEKDKERRIDFKKEESILDGDKVIEVTKGLENVDLGKDALSYLIYESQNFEMDTEHAVSTQIEGSLAQELKEAEIKEMLDLSPELIIDEAIEPKVFTKEVKGIKPSPVIPERAKLKKSNSLEDLSQREESEKSSPKTKTIAFKVPETQPRDIPRTKLRTMSGSSPKSLPESLNKPCPLTKLDSTLKKRKKVSSLGKMAKDSLLALNMSEDEITEYRRSYVTSAESLRSLESVSEDANSQSGTSIDSRCRSCLRTSQESLMSLDSITEDCKCGSDCEKSRSFR